MIRKLLRWLGLLNAEADSGRFEPVYGLPKWSLEEWLSRNPALRENYAADLARASKSRRRNFKDDRNESSPQRSPIDAGRDPRAERSDRSLSDPFARTSA